MRAIPTKKNLLRKELLKIRASVAERDEKNALIAEKLFVLAKNFKSVFIYVSMNSEVDTHGIITNLASEKEVFVPYTYANGIMRAARLPSAVDLKATDRFGNVLSSSEHFFDGQAELNVVPLLGFDCECYRIGYGAGCYDRYFEKHSGGLKAGLAFEEQLCEFARVDTDFPMDIIITPARVIRRIK